MDTNEGLAADLYRVADELRRRNADPAAELTLWTWEGDDSSEVIGTAAGFLRLAEAAVRVAADAYAGRLLRCPESANRCLFGSPAATSFEFEELFDLVSDSAPRRVVVVENEEARKGVAGHRGRFLMTDTTYVDAGAEPGDDQTTEEPPTPGPIPG